MIFSHELLLLQPVVVFGMYALKITLCSIFNENIPYIGQYIFQGRTDLREEFQCKAGRSFLLEPNQVVPLWDWRQSPRGWVGDCNQRGILRHVWNWPNLPRSEGFLLCVKSQEQNCATLNIWMLHHICQRSPPPSSPPQFYFFLQQQHRHEAAPCSTVIPWLLFTVELMHLCQQGGGHMKNIHNTLIF